MIWKAIGSSVIGSSHLASGKECEDAVKFSVVHSPSGSEVLICCVSDGAGSAAKARWASAFTTQHVTDALTEKVSAGEQVTANSIFECIEHIFDSFTADAASSGSNINDYACTILGCCLSADRSVFFHIGDGAIVRADDSGFYAPVWWPDNGEYHNTTSFITDDKNLPGLKVLELDEPVREAAIFSDGLQMLALSMEQRSAHQPFFTDLFRYLRMADVPEKIALLNTRLEEYLGSERINARTDDDKTLFLATTIPE